MNPDFGKHGMRGGPFGAGHGGPFANGRGGAFGAGHFGSRPNLAFGGNRAHGGFGNAGNANGAFAPGGNGGWRNGGNGGWNNGYGGWNNGDGGWGNGYGGWGNNDWDYPYWALLGWPWLYPYLGPEYGYSPSYNSYYSGPTYGTSTYSYNRGNSTVAQVQQDLAQQGYYQGQIDGLLGPYTQAAISAYQRDAGLAITGSIDTGLLHSLGMQ